MSNREEKRYMEKHVTNLEISKRLKELGVKQESEFKYCGGHIYYDDDQENGKFEECPNTDLLGEDEYCHTAGLTCEYFISAFLASELGELLPLIVKDGFHRGRFVIEKTLTDKWKATYVEREDGGRFALDNSDENMANSMGKMLIYLLENNLIELGTKVSVKTRIANNDRPNVKEGK